MNEKRVEILKDTIKRLYQPKDQVKFRNLALKNVKRWCQSVEKLSDNIKIKVVPDDWGVATLTATKKYGEIFAVLNMANKSEFGGGYTYGTSAQEENIFRRTDCHFTHPEIISEFDQMTHSLPSLHPVKYSKTESCLIESLSGKCYFDSTPRVCIKGPEDRSAEDLGYSLLDEENVFPFFELRSAALDLSNIQNQKYSEKERLNIMDLKIEAQLNTLIENNVKNVILGAFGCGIFKNKASDVAKLYKKHLDLKQSYFNHVIFAIYHAGYGPDNYTPFKHVLCSSPLA